MSTEVQKNSVEIAEIDFLNSPESLSMLGVKAT